jgi:hypothetical protein
MGAAWKYAVINPATGKLDRRIFSDQAIYDDEIEKIFGRAWLRRSTTSSAAAPTQTLPRQGGRAFMIR